MHIRLGVATPRPTGRQPVSLIGRVGALIRSQDHLVRAGPPLLATGRAHARLDGAPIRTRNHLVRAGPRVLTTCHTHARLDSALIRTRNRLVRAGPRVRTIHHAHARLVGAPIRTRNRFIGAGPRVLTTCDTHARVDGLLGRRAFVPCARHRAIVRLHARPSSRAVVRARTVGRADGGVRHRAPLQKAARAQRDSETHRCARCAAAQRGTGARRPGDGAGRRIGGQDGEVRVHGSGHGSEPARAPRRTPHADQAIHRACGFRRIVDNRTHRCRASAAACHQRRATTPVRRGGRSSRTVRSPPPYPVRTRKRTGTSR